MPFSPAHASTPLVIVINEIAWSGTEEAWYFEWIELANNTKKEIDLSGWKIKNAGAKNRALELEGKIPPYGFFLICKKEIEGCGLESWQLSLNDNYKENGSLILENKNEEVVDQTPSSSSSRWPAGSKETKQTMERVDQKSSGANTENWQTSQSSKGTPGSKNGPKPSLPEKEASFSPKISPKEPAQCTRGIIINEILPSPEGQDSLEEWIELYNKNSFWADLSFFQIQDTAGKTKSFTLPQGTSIEGQSFQLLKSSETKIALNNDGDGLKLFCPDGELIDEAYYQKAKTGESFCRINEEWHWCSSPTPKAKNLLSREETTDKAEDEQLFGALIKSSPEKFFKNSSGKNFFFSLSVAAILASASSILVYFLKKKKRSEKRR